MKNPSPSKREVVMAIGSQRGGKDKMGLRRLMLPGPTLLIRAPAVCAVTMSAVHLIMKDGACTSFKER
mgnify:CR=1 FL=1